MMVNGCRTKYSRDCVFYLLCAAVVVLCSSNKKIKNNAGKRFFIGIRKLSLWKYEK